MYKIIAKPAENQEQLNKNINRQHTKMAEN